MVREDLIEHLKCHQYTWERYLELNHSFLDREYNYSKLVQSDERKSNDLKLSVGIIHDDGNLIIRFPKSRVARRRYTACRNAQNSDRWSNSIAKEYQSNHIGGYQGNFDKPICEYQRHHLSFGN